jgi:poly-gamma-glutamate capsule biosynthesis protein CapA/YwtB (metallophosphatase superfamily)
LTKETISICAVGDVVIRDEAKSSVLELAKPVLKAADITFGNCESAYSEEWTRNGPSESGQGLVMLAHPRNVAALADAGFDVMNFANNHNLDSGDSAFLNTLANLKKHGIVTCGAGANIEEARRPAIVEAKGVKVALLGYSSIRVSSYEAGPTVPGSAPLKIHTYYRPFESEQPGCPAIVETTPDESNLSAMQRDVARAKEQAAIVIVSPHWGIHFKPAQISSYETLIAHAAIDAGADMVFGHHAHIMKGIQVYKGKAIVHCLGNFAFALDDMADRMAAHAAEHHHASLSPHMRLYREFYGQYLMGYNPEARSYPFHPEARNVAIGRFTVENGRISRVAIIPCYVNANGQPEPLKATHEKFDQVAAYLADVSARAGFDTKFVREDDEIVVVTESNAALTSGSTNEPKQSERGQGVVLRK